MARPLTAPELETLGRSLLTAAALVELAVVGVCLVAAWIVARLLRGRAAAANSVLFGERLFDGALLPALALAFALLARHLLPEELPRAVFPIAIAMLLSLPVIRFGVRVLRAAFPASPLMRIAELAFKCDRYHADPRFPGRLAELRHRRWMRSIVESGDPGARTYVTGEPVRRTGFVSLVRQEDVAALILAAVALGSKADCAAVLATHQVDG